MSVVSEPACYVLVRRGDAVLFVLREHTGYMDGSYSLPAGRVEQAETYAQGAIREVAEEVGLTIKTGALQHAYTMHRWTANSQPEARTDLFFEVVDWQGDPVNNEPDKHTAIAWLPIDNLPENIMDYQRYALMELTAGRTYGEFGWPEIVKTV